MTRTYIKKKLVTQQDRYDREVHYRYFVSWFLQSVIDTRNGGVSIVDIKKYAPVNSNNTVIHLARYLQRNFRMDLYSFKSKYYVVTDFKCHSSINDYCIKDRIPSLANQIKTSVAFSSIKTRPTNAIVFVRKHSPSKVFTMEKIKPKFIGKQESTGETDDQQEPSTPIIETPLPSPVTATNDTILHIGSPVSPLLSLVTEKEEYTIKTFLSKIELHLDEYPEPYPCIKQGPCASNQDVYLEWLFKF